MQESEKNAYRLNTETNWQGWDKKDSPCVLLRFILQVAISVCICRHEDSEVKIYRREQSEKSTNQRQAFLAMCILA